MLAKLGKSILQRTITYQRRGLSTLRHAVILMLGTGLASAILVFSGHNPFIPEPTHAVLGWFALEIISALTDIPSISSIFIAVVGGFLTSIVGLMMVLMMSLAVAVASYDVVINTPNVILAWKVLRDIVNLFFVIILLVIAIGTTLRREQYMWNKNLPRFIIAAIFVNFSRTIVAFVTDFADVIQQTFTSGFTTTYFAKFVASFGVTFFLSATTGEDITFNGVPVPDEVVTAIATVIALIMEFIVMAIMFVYFALFLVRVVGLWLIAIFGPVAFVSSILPQTQKYYKDWWSKLANLALIGPMLAFFMWLGVTLIPDPATGAETFAAVLTGVPPQIGAAGQPSFIIGFCLMTIVMYFGMQQAMGLAGDFGAVVGKAQSFAFGTMLGGISGGIAGGVFGAARFAGKDLLSRADYGQMRLRQAGAKGLQGALGLKEGSAMFKVVGALGAGGTVSGLRKAFTDRAEEGQKRRLEAGMKENNTLAANVSTWPVLKAVELLQGKASAKGDVQETAGGEMKTALDIMQDNTTSVADRQKAANENIDDTVKKARENLAAGNITQGDFNEIEALANRHRALVNSGDWNSRAAREAQEKNLDRARTRQADLKSSIPEREEKIAELLRQYAAQEAILLNPASTPAQQAAASAEMTRLEDERLIERAALDSEVSEKNTLPGQIAGLEAAIAAMKPTVDADDLTIQAVSDQLRGEDSDLIAKGQQFSTGAWGGIAGRTLVNLGDEAGTQRYLDAKSRRESALKEVDRATDGDPTLLVNELAKAQAAGNAEKVEAILEALSKGGELSQLMSNYRMQPAMERLFKEKAQAEQAEKFRQDPTNPLHHDPASPAGKKAIDDFVAEFRRAPNNKGNIDMGLELLLKQLYKGDKEMVAKILGNIRSAGKDAYGANTSQTYVDTVTGKTQLIEMKVIQNSSGKWEVKYDDKALKALNASLKGMKPGEFISSLKKAHLFSSDADGNVQSVSPLFANYIKAMPAVTEKLIRERMSQSVKQAIKENVDKLEQFITDNPASQAAIKTRRLIDEMKKAKEL